MSTCCASRPARPSRHQRRVVGAGDVPDVRAPDVRAGDIERERTATRLGQAFTQGYLSMEEYEARLSQAFAATNVGALTHLTCRSGRSAGAIRAVGPHGARPHVVVCRST